MEKLVVANQLPDKWARGEPITVENFATDTIKAIKGLGIG